MGSRYSDVWPIYEKAGDVPDGFTGWPLQKKAAVIFTHDVDTETGHRRCRRLVQLEEDSGFKSAFYFVPERYRVSAQLLQWIKARGFEVGVHGLNHDGKLFVSTAEFQKRAAEIKRYIREWGCRGFSAPGMHHNLEWIQQLNVEYDISTYDTDPFEPQGGGVGTIFPFYVINCANKNHYLEIPYTLPQDFTLLVLMKEGIDLWKRKVDWIFDKGGVVHLRSHPDYMNFGTDELSIEEYPAGMYAELLQYINTKYMEQYWNPLPIELARFWAENYDAGRPRSARKASRELLCACCRRLMEQNRIYLTSGSVSEPVEHAFDKETL